LDLAALQETQKVRRHLTITKDLVQQARSDSLAGMHRDHGASAIFMPKKVVAAFDSHNSKARFSECVNQLTAR